ncbi:hypothetical protein FRC10_008108 [Ceratobasidium sp. 414]|nr:hypothetical protein FRC10_008108 [Ceratobasidium sp. 414]
MSAPDLALDKSRQVFNIPELVSLIAGFSEPRDRTQLLCVCKNVFKAVLPHVWWHVSGVRHLLYLISGATWDIIHTDDDGLVNQIQLSGCLTIENPFRRFDLYAPLVRKLDICGLSYNYVKISGWWTLISRNRQHALLPNLHTIAMNSSLNAHGPDQAMWIQALGSPSLLDLIVTPTTLDPGPTVSYPMASFILKSAVDLCPNLRRLGLFPDVDLGNTGQDSESYFLMLLSHEPFYTHLAGLNGLRDLSGTSAWFNKKPLGVLSRVPHLESLAVYEQHDERLDIMENSLPLDAFPSLRQLALRMLHPYDMSKLLMTKGLVNQLTRLELNFDSGVLNGAINKEEWLCKKIIQPLQNMPSLVSFTIHPLGEIIEIGPEALAIFAQVPLREVSLINIRIRADCLNYNLGVAWPNATLLDMPAQRVSLATLVYFASLPKLKELVLTLDLKSEPMPTSGRRSLSLNVLRLGSGVNTICTGAMELDFVAR